MIGEIEKRSAEFITKTGDSYSIDYQFVQLSETTAQNHVFLRTSNDGVSTVAQSFQYNFDMPDSNPWYVLCDSDYFDENVDVFRQFDLQGLDVDSEHLKDSLKKEIDAFFQDRYKDYYSFSRQLESDDSYPYKNTQPSSRARRSVFNQIAFDIEERHSLLKKNIAIRKLVYALTDRALNEDDFEGLLKDVLQLDANTLEHYRRLREKTSIASVIRFSEKIVQKLQFLSFLRKITIEEESKHILERSELHKFVERHLWIFGEVYKDSPCLFSDSNLRNNLIALRGQCFAESDSDQTNDEDTGGIDEAVDGITDLFFFNERIIDEDRKEVMIVELKAPKVSIGMKEEQQAMRYAQVLMDSAKYPENISFRIILISKKVQDVIAAQAGTQDSKRPYVHRSFNNRDIEIWVHQWSDLIERNFRQLTYLSNCLEVEDQEVVEYWKEEFPDVPIDKFESKLSKSK